MPFSSCLPTAGSVLPKALNKPEVLTSLMTAESNGLLEESRFELDEAGEVRMFFRAGAESIATINNYIR